MNIYSYKLYDVLNRWAFRCFLNTGSVLAVVMPVGKLFQRRGTAMPKARSLAVDRQDWCTISFLISLSSWLVAVGQFTRPQVLAGHPCPVPTPTVQPCHVMSACRCNGCSWCDAALVQCCHAVVGREHMLSFLTRSSVQGTSVV